jgi:site-specific DNA recombinase
MTVNFAADTYLDWGSTLETMRAVNRRGYRTKEYTSRSDKVHPAREFTYTGIQWMLMNSAYIGKKEVNKSNRFKDQTTLPESLRIIDEKTFRRAQKRPEANSGRSPRNTKHEYLLRSLLRCGDKHRTFPEPKKCQVASVNAGPIEEAVWARICEAVSNPELIANQIENLKRRVKKENATAARDLKAIEKELVAADGEDNRILDLYREGLILREKLTDQLAKVQEKRKRLSEEKRALTPRLDEGGSGSLNGDDVFRYCESIRARLKALSCDFEGRRRILGLLADEIVLQGKTVRIRGTIPTARHRKGQDTDRIHVVLRP